MTTRRPPDDVAKATWLDAFLIRSLLGIVFVAPLLFIKGIFDFANLPQMAFIQVGGVFLLFLWLFKSALRRQCSLSASPFIFPLCCFILWSLVSLFYTVNKYEGLLPLMHWTVSGLVFFVVLNNVKKKDIPRLLTAIFLAGCCVALLGIIQHLVGFSWIPQVMAPAATFGNKNMAVHFIVLSLPLGVTFLLLSRNRLLIWLLSVFSSLMVLYLLYTGARAGWLAVIVEIFLFAGLLVRDCSLFDDGRYWRRTKGAAVVVSLLVVLLMVNLNPAGGITARVTGGYASIEARLAIWANTMEMIREHPLTGVGLGNHKIFYPLYQRKIIKDRQFSDSRQLQRVHNDYLQVFAELGLIGILILAWLGIVLLLVIRRLTASAAQPRAARCWTMGIAVAIGGLLVNAAFSFPFQRAVPPFVMLLLLGILGVLYGAGRKKNILTQHRVLLAGAAILVFVAWLGLIRFYYRGLQSDRHYLNVARLEKKHDWPGVIVEGKRAYNYNPARVKLLSYVGRAYLESGEYRAGIEALEKMTEAYPNHMNSLLNLGVAYAGMGENERARQTFEKVLRIAPDYAKGHNNLANLYLREKDLDKALEEFKVAAELDPDNSLVFFNIGTVEIQKKQYRQAAAAFERVVALAPGDAVARKNLGILYYQYLNRKEDGIYQFRKALRLNPMIKGAARIRNIVKRWKE